jgi:DNA-binding MarR family transcriptional regulator
MSSDSQEKPALPTVGALLRLAWLAFRERMYATVQAAGYTDLGPAHVLVFRYPTIEGLRPSDLAAQMGISKQAMNDLLRHLEKRGYLVLQPDPADGRARLISLSDRGSELMELTHTMAQDVADEWALRVGRDRLDALRQTLIQLVHDR